MMYKPVVLHMAQYDMADILRYIKAELKNPIAARRLYEKMIKEAERLRTCLHKTGVRICGKILSMARQKSAGILAYFKDF